MPKPYKKDQDKFKYLFQLDVTKHDYDFIKNLAHTKKISIRKLIRQIIDNHYSNPK
jgi:hypothetical protein